jgi:phosphatidylglycerophosphatase A
VSTVREPEAPRLATMVGRPHQLLALVFGIGAIPVWPGACGTLAGFALFAALQPLPVEWRAAAYIFLLAAGSWAVRRTGDDLGAPDHNAIVLDETLAMSLVLEFVAPGLGAWIAAFLVFRLFDVTKPWPIRLVHNTGKGGFAVILDDLMAGLYTVAVVRIVFQPAFG